MVARCLLAAALALMFYSSLLCSMLPSKLSSSAVVTVLPFPGADGALFGPLLLISGAPL